MTFKAIAILMVVCLLSCCLAAQSDAFASSYPGSINTDFGKKIANKGNLGLGIGIPYGVLGLGAELYIGKYASLDAGFGIGTEGVAWEIGGRWYVAAIQDKTFRPRVSLFYGTNGFLSVYNWGWDYYQYDGLTGGVGTQLAFGNRRQYAVDFDIMFILTSGLYDVIDYFEDEGYNVEDTGRVKISLGCRYNF